MKILLSRHPVVASGGAERAALDFGTAFSQLGHKVFLWGPWESCTDFVDIAQKNGIEILRYTSRSHLGEMAELRDACKQFGIDVILSDGRRYNALTPFAILGLPVLHLPVLRSLPSTWDEPRSTTIQYRMAVPFWNAFWLHMLRRSLQIVCVSNAVAIDAQRLLRVEKRKTPVIYDAVGVANWKAEIPACAKSPLPFKLILVGRLQPVKHLEMIFPLMQELQRLGEDVVVEIVGSGECRDNLMKAIHHLGFEDRIRLLGYREDVMALYQDAHVLMHFGEGEACGRVYIEAQMNGLPVVCVSGGGTAELVRDGITGFLHEPGHVAEMALSVARLKNDATIYKEMSDNAQRWAKTFSTVAMAENYDLMLRETLNNLHISAAQHGASI